MAVGVGGGCTVDPGAPSEPTSEPSPSAAPSASPEPTPPPWLTRLADELSCDGPVAPIGAGADPDDGSGGAMAPTFEESVEAFVAHEAGFYATLPLEKWATVDEGPRWGLIAHVVDGQFKAVASFTHPDEPEPWMNWQVAACDASEFELGTKLSYDTRIWVDEFAANDPIPTTRLFERADCDGARILRLNEHLYVRDPEGAFDPAMLLDTYDGDLATVGDMIPTGYRDGDRFLFQLLPDTAIHVVDGRIIERWPRVAGDEIVRVDCN